MLALLRELRDRGVAPYFVTRILAALAEPQPIEPAAAFGPPDLIEPLTKRELEVLALLEQRLSNKEIAARLFITPSTAKPHTLHIYQKLQVNTRRDAVVMAGAWTSTAAGAYQSLSKTWDALVEAYDFEDFSPKCQDEAAVPLIHGRKALDDVIAGRFDEAIKKCGKEWASLPGSPYGQPTMTLEQARMVYKALGGEFEEADLDAWDFDPDSLETEHYGDSMSPIIIPLIQAAATLIPQLASHFGSGSEVANRNIAAAKVLGEEIVRATNTPNLEAAVEKMQKEPEPLAAAKSAVATVYPELFEVGGGVIEAGKASQSPEFHFWKNAAFWISLILIVMPFMLLADVFYVHPHAYTENLRTQIVTAVLMVISMVSAFWLGTSFGSQRKTNLLAGKE